MPPTFRGKERKQLQENHPNYLKVFIKVLYIVICHRTEGAKKKALSFAFKVYSTQPHIGGHTLNNFPSNSDTFALIHSHTFICHRGKLYLRWIKKALRKMGDISDLKPNKGVRKSQKSVPPFHDVKESVLKKKTTQKTDFPFFLSLFNLTSRIHKHTYIYISILIYF